jgi:hypothetical protein
MKANELIAEFMEVDQVDIDTWLEDNLDLEYHTSWDWLMPVVRKCGDIRQEIREGNIPTDVEDYWDEILEGLQDADLEYTYKSIRQFILWYNQKQ